MISRTREPQALMTFQGHSRILPAKRQNVLWKELRQDPALLEEELNGSMSPRAMDFQLLNSQ